MKDRLRQARIDAGFKSARAAAIKFGWTPSTYAAHENGQNEFDGTAARTYGKAFKSSPGYLLTGEGPREAKNILRIMGLIGAGAEIYPDFEQVPPDGLYEIEAPFSIPDDAIAFEVKGESMWPRYDNGDIIVTWKFSVDLSQIIGWEAAVRTTDNRRFLKRILLGAEPHTYDLESYNAPPIRGVRLDWAGQVNAVIRATDWKARDAKARKRMLDRIVNRS